MDRAANQPVQNDRTRYLNIVYFVESARSHTIRINLRYARWAIGAAAIVVAWAAGSIFWIASLRWQVEETRERLESSLTTIFDYQIKNDKVFELAYPVDATKSYYSEAAQLASNNPTTETKVQTPAADLTKPAVNTPTSDIKPAGSSAKPDSTATVAKVEAKPTEATVKSDVQPSQAPVASQPGLLASAATTQAQPVTKIVDNAAAKPAEVAGSLLDISGTKLARIGNRIELVFDINNRRPERASGYIWAVATFSGQNGKTMYSGAPNHLQLESTSGKIKSFKSGYRFAIQRYKKKDFEFKTPASKDWKLTKVTIHFTDMNNSKEDVINVPVEQLASGQGSEAPATETPL